MDIQYYTTVVLICCATTGIMSLLIHDNDRFSKEIKTRFYQAYLIICFAAIFEWIAIILNGSSTNTIWIHTIAKGMDYILSPAISVSFVFLVPNIDTVKKHLRYLLIFNLFLQIISMFTGWTFYIDAMNYYHHGPLHILYIIVYVISLLALLIGFRFYSHLFRKQNLLSLYCIIGFVVGAIIMQEVFNDSVRVIYLVVTIAALMLYVHYTEYAQIKKDDVLFHQQRMLETDALTNLCSRHAYAKAIDKYRKLNQLPNDFVIMVMDINGLKEANDTYGHEVGDELITGAAQCISDQLHTFGTCYRVGGDEFVAILTIPSNLIPQVLQKLKDNVKEWKGTKGHTLSLSIGYCEANAYTYKNIQELIEIADFRMYDDKAVYYKTIGKDRRHRYVDDIL